VKEADPALVRTGRMRLASVLVRAARRATPRYAP